MAEVYLCRPQTTITGINRTLYNSGFSTCGLQPLGGGVVKQPFHRGHLRPSKNHTFELRLTAEAQLQ